MDIKQILDRGIEKKEWADKSFSHTGQADFKEVAPQIVTVGGKPAYSRPRTKASANNSYT